MPQPSKTNVTLNEFEHTLEQAQFIDFLKQLAYALEHREPMTYSLNGELCQLPIETLTFSEFEIELEKEDEDEWELELSMTMKTR